MKYFLENEKIAIRHNVAHKGVLNAYNLKSGNCDFTCNMCSVKHLDKICIYSSCLGGAPLMHSWYLHVFVTVMIDWTRYDASSRPFNMSS